MTAAAAKSPEPERLDLPDAIDRLGTIKADIADLTAEKRALDTAIIATGVTEAEGDLFRVVVIPEMTAIIADGDKIKKFLVKEFGLAAWKRRFTKKSTKRATVKVTARKRAD